MLSAKLKIQNDELKIENQKLKSENENLKNEIYFQNTLPNFS